MVYNPNACILCNSTADDVEVRLVYPRHRTTDETPTARRLCERCNAQYHWHPSPSTPARPSYGYRTVNGRLIKKPAELETIKRIIELRHAGTSWNKIVGVLESERRPTAQGGAWHVQTVINIYRREYPESAAYSETCYGYASKAGRVIEDEREQEVLRWMKDAREEGASFTKIANALNDHQIPTKRGKKWYSQTVATILLREGVC